MKNKDEAKDKTLDSPEPQNAVTDAVSCETVDKKEDIMGFHNDMSEGDIKDATLVIYIEARENGKGPRGAHTKAWNKAEKLLKLARPDWDSSKIINTAWDYASEAQDKIDPPRPSVKPKQKPLFA